VQIKPDILLKGSQPLLKNNKSGGLGVYQTSLSVDDVLVLRLG
jgi:hypothetical protein